MRASTVVLAAAFALFGISARADPLDTAFLPPMKSAQVYGQTIRYYDMGTGPDLVLLHGLGSTAAFDWGRVMVPLSKHYHVIALDQLGFGSSSKPLVAYGIQTWVDMLDGLLKVRGVTHFTLVGESLGGWIAAQYTLQAETNRAMTLPDRLVLSDAAGHRSLLHAGSKPFANALSLSGERAGLSMVFHDHAMLTDTFIARAFASQLAAGNGYTVDSFWKTAGDPAMLVDGKLGAITVPTLVVWGAEDQLVPLADGQDYARNIPHATLVVVPECGHAPPIEKPAAFLAAMMSFLQQTPASDD